MNERTPPEGTPDEMMPPDAGSAEPPTGDPSSAGPIGWPEQGAGAASPAPPETAAPAVQWQAPPPAAPMPVGKPPRTTLSAVAGVVLLVLGIIGLLFGVLFVASAALVGQLLGDFAGQIPGASDGVTPEQIIGGVIGFFGVIVIAYSVVYILGGIGVLRSADWGRVMGLIVAIISGLIWGGSLSGPSEGLAFALAMFLIHLYVFFVLAFKWRQPAPPMPLA